VSIIILNNGYTIIRFQFNNQRAHNFTNTYSCQVHKQTRLFLEHTMCLDNSNMCGTNSFISEVVASDAYRHIITTRIRNTAVSTTIGDERQQQQRVWTRTRPQQICLMQIWQVHTNIFQFMLTPTYSSPIAWMRNINNIYVHYIYHHQQQHICIQHI